MFRTPPKQLLRAWIALVAFVFGLLAPTLSHAFAAPRTAMQATEVCTAAGMVMMPLAGDSAPDGGALPGMPHCDVCCPHTTPLLLPVPPALLLLSISGRDTHPPLFYQSPAPQFAWTPAQSRAPPFF